jgi:4-hydroxybenzoate polyprenyltransferase
MSGGEFLIVALVLIGFGFLLGCSTDAFVALAIIVMGFVLSLSAQSVGLIGNRIWDVRTDVD